MTREEFLKGKVYWLDRDIASAEEYINKPPNNTRKDKIALLILKEIRLMKELRAAYGIELLEIESINLKRK